MMAVSIIQLFCVMFALENAVNQHLQSPSFQA